MLWPIYLTLPTVGAGGGIKGFSAFPLILCSIITVMSVQDLGLVPLYNPFILVVLLQRIGSKQCGTRHGRLSPFHHLWRCCCWQQSRTVYSHCRLPALAHVNNHTQNKHNMCSADPLMGFCDQQGTDAQAKVRKRAILCFHL